jgi:hypothetical protein
MVMEQHFKIKYNNIHFGATVVTNKDLGETLVKFGGTTQCIDIKCYDDDPVPHIEGIKYNRKCSIDGDLKKGDGTISMVKAALIFVCNIFENIQGFTLKDTSTLKCQNKIEIPLYYFYMTKYKKTWYMMKFNAKPENSGYYRMLLQTNKFLDAPIQDQFDVFYEKYVKRNKSCFDDYGIDIKRVLEAVYNTSKTYREFIIKLMQKYDCIILKDWHRYMMSTICHIPFGEAFWKINRKDILDWNQDITIQMFDKKTFIPKRRQQIVNDPFNLNGGHGSFCPYGNGPFKFEQIN